MERSEFRARAHELVDWMADYLEEVERFPVLSRAKPGELLKSLPLLPPDKPEPFEQIFGDFKEIILPGMTHWQHPSFFAYFTGNTSGPSILAEMLTATMGAQCMSWITSPAATELEQRMMEWLRAMTGLPEGWSGVIQDTASTATLCSLLTARESRSHFAINSNGFPGDVTFTCYCSTEAHSSVEKAVKIAGIGKDHLRKIPVDERYAMVPAALERAMEEDLRMGFTPLAAVAAVGTTGSTAIDPLRAIGEICRHHGVWLHVDAAFAGTALILPEMRWMIDGVELADSFVFNPHKWMFTNFDCSAYFVRDAAALVRTFEILPEYLKTPGTQSVNNYRDWGIQLGRRFRALKLWFVIRHYGLAGLREKIREHLRLARGLADRIAGSPSFELLAPVPLNTICFRFKPRNTSDPGEVNRMNELLMQRLNESGKLFLTQTKLNGQFTLRLVIAQTEVQQRHVDEAWNLIEATAGTLP